MIRLLKAGIEKTLRWTAEIAGFNTLDDSKTRGALRRLVYLVAFAWGLGGLAMLSTDISPMAGVVLLSFVTAVLAGGILIMSDTNFELAKMVATAPMPSAPRQPPQQRAPAMHLPGAQSAAAHMPPPLPELSSPEPAPVPRAIMSSQQPAGHHVLSRGIMEGRAYAVFSDGSIELETTFGPRWFASIDLAHEFIGLRNGSSLRLSSPELARVA